MWIVAGVLLGSMVLAAIASLHVGPHGHGVAAILGAVAAAWLLVMLAEGRGRPLLFGLLGADLVMSAMLGLLAYKGFTDPQRGLHRRTGPEGAHGIALSDLDPSGIVRVDGEEWTAESVNGPVAKGGRVQVLSRQGVRIQVWGEAPGSLLAGGDDELRVDGSFGAGPVMEPALVEPSEQGMPDRPQS
ncbi:MAG TPA: NfeD family protein [Acidimicrobiales bacterium]|nr:NfeD family protein [Acidimicrobiales bacterium]